MFLLQLLAFGAYVAGSKYCENKRIQEYRNKPNPIDQITEQTHKNIIEIAARSGKIVDPKTGKDQYGNTWIYCLDMPKRR